MHQHTCTVCERVEYTAISFGISKSKIPEGWLLIPRVEKVICNQCLVAIIAILNLKENSKPRTLEHIYFNSAGEKINPFAEAPKSSLVEACEEFAEKQWKDKQDKFVEECLNDKEQDEFLRLINAPGDLDMKAMKGLAGKVNRRMSPIEFTTYANPKIPDACDQSFEEKAKGSGACGSK